MRAFDTCQALFFDQGDQLPIAYDAGGWVGNVTAESENIHVLIVAQCGVVVSSVLQKAHLSREWKYGVLSLAILL